MKKIVTKIAFAAALVTGAALVTAAPASAQSVGVTIGGPGYSFSYGYPGYYGYPYYGYPAYYGPSYYGYYGRPYYYGRTYYSRPYYRGGYRGGYRRHR
jgi:hypothetical protein